jgi:hypothetical protein
MIVDFRIKTRSGGYFNSDIVDQFYAENGDSYQSLRMILALRIPQDEKERILRESLQEWNLLDNIDKTLLEMDPLTQKLALKSHGEDDLQRYVEDVKATIRILR